ncbi:cytochrome c-type biogenesis protein CcmH [Ancylobacter lacus]|nr:cytochrome c-type biogenesis protein [Ancylobacter lacus]MBS7539405.1 cytochrome c-type biogenesis protein CcmH [Ancylobacter lacus]
MPHRRGLLRRLALLAWLAGVGLSAVPPALAVQPDEVLADPALEARARVLSKELRCMVCQNQSIDDSDAPLARDLRVLVRERLKAGDSDQQVLDYLVDRYGEFVLMRPTLHGANVVLWIAPFLVLAAGGIGIIVLARRRMPSATVPLSGEEEARLRALVASDAAAGAPDSEPTEPARDLTKV